MQNANKNSIFFSVLEIRWWRNLRGIILTFLMSRRKKLETLSFLVLINFLTAALGWLTQIKIANTLGKELFGQVAFGLVLGTYGQVFIRFGLDRTLVRDLVHHKEHFAELVHASLILRFILALITLLFLVLSIFLTDINSGIVLVAIGFSLLSLDLQPVYDTWHKIKRHTTYYLIHRASYLLIIWGIIVLFPKQLSVKTIGLSLIFSVIFYLFLQHTWAMKHLQPTCGGTRDLWLKVWWLVRENWLIWISAIGGVVVVMFNQPILKQFAGYIELGGYAAAWQIVMVGSLFLDQVSRIGRPEMARKTTPDVTRTARIQFVSRYAAIMTLVVFPLFLLMFFAPELIFKLMFKPEFLPAARTLPVLGGYLLMLSLGMVASQYVLSARLNQSYFLSILVGGIVSVCLCLVLIPKFGTGGAAWALVISHGATMIVYCIAMVRHVKSQG